MDALRIRYEFDDGLAIITLARPEAGNALDGSCTTELRELAMRCSLDPSLRAVLLRAEGNNFCFGGDLGFMSGSEDIAWAIRSTVVDYHLAIEYFAKMNAPLVIAVQGAAAGAGLALAAVGDYVLSGENAKFSFAYDSVGLSGDGGITWTLPRLMGMRKFKDFVFGGKRLSAQQAREIGIVSEIVADADLQDAAHAHARRLAIGPTQAYGAIKRLAAQSYASSFSEQLAREADTVSELARGPDASGAIQAVLAGARPAFTGR
jgi:2-(1,2-epoxy-1,2-dihydrophenyl)acetyl-CoA isomerase